MRREMKRQGGGLSVDLFACRPKARCKANEINGFKRRGSVQTGVTFFAPRGSDVGISRSLKAIAEVANFRSEGLWGGRMKRIPVVYVPLTPN